MRKPRDYDTELKALDDKARRLKARRVQQLGELVIASGAGALPVEQLVGALLGASDADTATKEAWAKRAVSFFQRTRQHGRGTAADAGGASPNDGASTPA